MLWFVCLLHAAWLVAPIDFLPRASAAAYRQAKPGQRVAGIHWTFRDIDIQTLLGRLKRFGVELPVPASGRVTVRLSIDAPWSSILRPGAYAVEGDLTSAALTVAGIELEQLSLHLVYKDGALDLTKMRFVVPEENGPGGTISGSARMQVRPAGDLNAGLTIDKLPIAMLAGTVPELAGHVSGTISGQFNGHVPANRLRDLTAWRADGRLTISKLEAFGLPEFEATTNLRLSQGAAAITRLTAQLAGARINASGGVKLAAPYAFNSRLQITVPDLGWLNHLEGDFRPPVAVAGKFSLSAHASGQLAPKRVRVRGNLDGRELKADNVTIDRLTVPFDGTLDRIRVNNLQIGLYGGRIVANLSLPTTPDGNVGAGVSIESVDLANAASDLLEQKQSWRGSASGRLQLQAPATRLADPTAWTGGGQLSFGRGNVFGIDLTSIVAPLEVADGRLTVRNLTVDSALGRVTGDVNANLATPFGFGTALRIAEVDFAQLNRLPEGHRPPVPVAGRAGISLRAQGTLQPVRFTARGGVATRRLRAEGVVIDSLNFNYQMSEQSLGLSQIAGTLNRGNFSGSATLGLVTPYDLGLKLNLTNADLSAVNGLPARFRPPATVGGTVSFSADLKGQLDPLRLRGDGNVQARNIRFDRVQLDSLGLSFSATDDVVNVSQLAVAAYRGRLDGTLKVPLAEAAEGAVDVRWQRINLGGMLTDLVGVVQETAVAKTAPSPLSDALSQARFAGWTWGSLSVHTPAGKLLDPASWTGNFDASLAALRLFGWSSKQGFLRAKLDGGRADLSRLAFDIGGTRLRGGGSLNLAEPFDFQSRFSLENLDLADFNKLPKEIQPPVKVSGTVSVAMSAQGTLEPVEVTGNGSITGDALQAGRARLDHLAIRFGAEKDRLTLNRFQADLYGGQFDGEAEIPLRGDDAGRVDFHWQAINLGQFITDVAKLPAALRGTIEGDLRVAVPGGKLGDPLAWNVNASFDTSPLVARAQPLGQLHGRLTYGGGLVDYRLSGDLLRGMLELAGRWQPRPPPRGKAVNEGHFELADAKLDAVTPLLAPQSALASLTGLVSADLRYRHGENTGLPAGTGNVTIGDVRLNGEPLLDELRGVVRLTKDRLEITNASATLAGGSVTASGYAFLDPRRRGRFRLSIDGAQIAQLMAPWEPPAAKISGAIDAQLDGFFGGRRPIVLSGTAALGRGRAAGLEVDSLRMPLHGTIDPVSGRGTVELHGLSGHIAHGRLTGDFELTLADGLGLNGRGKFTGIDLRTLMRQSGSTSQLASGKISGSYTLGGRNVRSAHDLTGTLDATLHDTQAMSLPIFERALPYLTGGISGSTTFDEGTVRGSLARGVMRVDRFSLSSGAAQVYAQGNVTLAGRLDLNVTVNTGQLNVPRRTLSLLASRILLVAAPPIGLLLNVTQFLSNQVINLEVTGTVRSPTIRIRPLNLIGQEAAQFFLLQAL